MMDANTKQKLANLGAELEKLYDNEYNRSIINKEIQNQQRRFLPVDQVAGTKVYHPGTEIFHIAILTEALQNLENKTTYKQKY